MTRTFDLVRGSLDEEKRTVNVTFSSEYPVERWFGSEILDHSKGSVRMDRITDGAPFLLNHNWDDQRGVVDVASISGKEGRATLRFSRSARGEELMQETKDGIRTKYSVGYRVHEFLLTIGENGQPDEYRATDWEPLEISSVPMGADPSAKNRAAHEDEMTKLFGSRAAEMASKITVRTAGQRTKENTNTTMAKPIKDQPEGEEIRSEENAPVTPAPESKRNGAEVTSEPIVETRSTEPEAPAAISPEDLQRMISKQVGEDRQRCEEIREIGSHFGLANDAIAKAIRENASVESVKLSIIEAQRSNPANAPIPTRLAAEPSPKGERGSREFCEDAWGRSALTVLRNAGYDVPSAPQVRVLSESRERNYIGGNSNTFHRTLTGALTLADVTVLDAGIGSPIIDETTAHAPELATFPVDVISGATVELSVMTSLPTVGGRNANEGTDWKKGTFESKIFQTAIIEERVAVDIQGVLNASKNPGRMLMAEAMSVAKAVAQHAGKQTWYGASAQSGADAKWSPGLYLQASSAATHVVDASGSSAKSSVWFLELGTGSLDHIYGNDTTLNFRDAWTEETVEDANNKKLRALTNYLSGRTATRLSDVNKAVRIKNLAASTQVLTDALMFAALKLCDDVGCQPNAIYMTSRSLNQLRDSRTTYHPLGLPAPLPTEFQGVPIYVTRNLSDAETI